MSHKGVFIDTGAEGIHVRRQDDGGVYIQTVDKHGRFHSGVTVPARAIPELVAQLGGAPSVIKGENIIEYRRPIMASNAAVKLPKLGETVTFITNKGTQVAAIVAEAPPRPGLDKGVISGLFVLDPAGTYFRKDVEYREGAGGWMWADHSEEDAVAARAAADAPARASAAESKEVETSDSKIAAAAAKSAETDADAGTSTTKKAARKKKA